jgi:hypothetical protein
MPEEELSTIIENLLNNAISATPAEGTIRIEVERTPQGTVRCTVADTGPGIPEAALERVFDPYYRIPERGAAGGTGLGLAISRRLADARGGRLLAANRPTGGAIFTLELPAAEAGARKWPVLHLAPVTSHAGLAAARAALDMHLPGPWRVLSWEGGVLAVEVEVQPAQAHKAAGDVADATDFACWLGGP